MLFKKSISSLMLVALMTTLAPTTFAETVEDFPEDLIDTTELLTGDGLVVGDYDDYDSYMLRVVWGNFDPTQAEALMETSTDWDGALSISGAGKIELQHVILFEENDQVEFADVDLQTLAFSSEIRGAYDGLLTKITVAEEVLLEDSSDDYPMITFEADFLDESIEVPVEELFGSVPYIYESGDYEVHMHIVTREAWLDWLSSHTSALEFVQLLEELIAMDVLEDETLEMIEVIMEKIESRYGESGFSAHFRRQIIQKLTDHAETLQELIDEYLAGSISDDDLNDEIQQEFERLEEEVEDEVEEETTDEEEMEEDETETAWIDFLESHVDADEFVEILSEIIDLGILDEDNASTLSGIIDSIEEKLESDGELAPFRKRRVLVVFTMLADNIAELLDAYEAEELNEEEFNEEIEDLFEIAKEKFDETRPSDDFDPSDIEHDAWYTEYLALMYDEGIISCYKDDSGELTGECGPADEVTFAEALTIAYRISGVVDHGHGSDTCPDDAVELEDLVEIYGDHWVNEDLACILQAGGDPTILEVIGSGEEHWDEPIPRFLALLTLFEVVMGDDFDDYIEAADTDDSFEDVSSLSSAAQAVLAAAKDAGIISGDGGEGRTFSPFRSFNRAEMFKVSALLFSVYMEDAL